MANETAIAKWQRIAEIAKADGNVELQKKAADQLRALQAPTSPATGGEDPPPTPPPTPQKEPRIFSRVGGAIKGAADSFADQLGSELVTVARGVGLVDVPDTPEILERESRAETMATRGLNSATLGASNLIANKTIGPGARYYREELAEKNPKSGFVGDLIGAVGGGIAGGGRLVGEAVTRGGAKLLPQVAAKMANTGGRMASGAGTALAENAVQNVVESGGDASTAADDPWLATIIGGGVPLVGAALRYGGRKLRGLSQWVDRYRQGVEDGDYLPPQAAPDQRTGVQKLTGEPAPADARPTSETTDYVQGERVKNRRAASDKAVHKFARRRNELMDQNRGKLRAAEAPHDEAPISRKNMRADIKAQIKANIDPANGKPINEDLHAALTSELKYVGKPTKKVKSSVLDKDGNAMEMEEPVPDSTLRTVIRRGRAHKEKSDWGSAAPSDAAKLARKKGGIWRRAIDRDAPESVRVARKDAAAEAKRLERDEDIVFRTEAEVARDGSTATDVTPSRPREAGEEVEIDDLDPTAIDEDIAALRAGAERQAAENTGKVDMRVAKELAGSDFFGRVGDVNEPGLRVEGLLEELAKRDPEGYAKIIEFVRSTKARDATRFGFQNQVPTNLPGAFSFLNRGAQLGRWAAGRGLVPGMEGGGEALRQLPAGRLVPFLRDPSDAVLERREQEKRKEKRK